MIYLVIFLILALGATSWLAWVNYRKYVKAVEYAENGFYVYNKFIASLYNKFKETLSIMNMIDHRGSFKADDEVGAAFDSMKECINELEQYISRYVETEEEK